MPVSFSSRRLRIQREAEQRFNADQLQIARAIGQLVINSASSRDEEGNPILPPSPAARTRLEGLVWLQILKPYFIGPGLEALGAQGQPNSPYTTLIVDGIRAATRNAVEQEVAILKRVASPTVYNWLTMVRPPMLIREARGIYEPYHLFVDPNGYRLSDRVWQSAIQTRVNINRMLDYHISNGTSAVQIATQVEQYLVPGQSAIQTRTPYGRVGNYAARRLARTEITAAAGRGTIDAAIANPYVERIRWRLSASHPRIDICDELASGGPDGDGIYPKSQVPSYPPHPHCLCSLLPVASPHPAALTAEMEAEIQRRTPRMEQLRGVMNVDWLVAAILGGFLSEALEGITP